jgi:hypothetical protein
VSKALLELLTVYNLQRVLKMFEDSMVPQQNLHTNCEHGSLIRSDICSAVAPYTLLVDKKRRKRLDSQQLKGVLQSALQCFSAFRIISLFCR